MNEKNEPQIEPQSPKNTEIYLPCPFKNGIICNPDNCQLAVQLQNRNGFIMRKCILESIGIQLSQLIQMFIMRGAGIMDDKIPTDIITDITRNKF